MELTEEPVSLKRLADYPIISLTEGTSSHDFYAELFLRHGLSFSPDVEVETTAQVPPVVQSDLGVGFVPREMLYGTPEASGIYPIMLEEPIPARSVFLFQRKTQPLSIAAKKLWQMLLEDAPQESGKIIRQSPAVFNSRAFLFTFLQIQQRFAQALAGASGKVLRPADAQERRAVDHALVFKLSVLAEENSDDVRALAPELSHLKAGVADGGVADVGFRRALAPCGR